MTSIVIRNRVLIVSNAFYPENSPRSFRATELAKEFSRQNHSVTVLTHRHPEQIAIENDFGIHFKDLGTPGFKSIEVKGIGVGLLIRRFLKRFLGLLFEYPDIQLVPMVVAKLKNEKGYDLLVSIAVPYPIHWGVARIYTKNKELANTWVADCGDPYMGDRTDSFRKPFYFKYVEKWFSRKADYISIPMEEARKAYYEEFHPKMVVIPQGVKFEDFTPTNAVFKPNNPVVFGYAGSFINGHRDPRPFIDFLLGLDLAYTFHIYTNQIELIAHQVERSKGKIMVHNYIPRKALILELSKMDFLVNIENNTKIQSPSKLIDYFLAGRPVLSVKSQLDNQKIIDEFLNRTYHNALELDDLYKHKIEYVAKQFTNLVPMQTNDSL